MTAKQILKRIRLNLRAARLALTGRWLSANDVAASYDALADHYDANWLVHLCRTTDRLHERLLALPNVVPPNMRTIDIGCGSGYSTCFLRQNLGGNITSVDISQNMLDQAATKIASNNAGIEFVCDDMLRFLQRQPNASADLIFSAWAIGYSVPGKIIAESSQRDIIRYALVMRTALTGHSARRVPD